MSRRSESTESRENRGARSVDQFGRPKESLETLNKLAHSLRSPLNSILGYTQMLLDMIPGEVNEAQTRYLTTIYDNGKLLLQTVNEIITWLNSGIKRQGFLRTRFNLGKILETVLRTPTSLIQTKNLHLAISDSATPVQVWGDQRFVEEIFHNILRVFAQIANNGSSIKVKIEELHENAKIEFKCSSISVLGEDLEQIIQNVFDSETLSGFEPPTSIQGLPTTKELLAEHGGRVQVDLKPNGAIELVLTLPRAQNKHYAI